MQVSYPTMELPATAMEALITQATAHTEINFTLSPSAQPAAPILPPKPIRASSLKKSKRLAASQASSSPQKTPYIPDAITAASLPSSADETPQPSITELLTATTALSSSICSALITGAIHKRRMRKFQKRYEEYQEMMETMKKVLKTMAERGLHEGSFMGGFGGKRFKVGAKVARALDGQEVVWEEGEEEWKEMIGGMMEDFEVIRAVCEGEVEIEVIGKGYEDVVQF